MAGPLQGIKVLDLTRVLAGPYCTMMLADMGAEVIKIERPDGGDDSRAYGPFVSSESAYFMSVNRGKKSVTLNLKAQEGRALLLEMVERVDVLVENFKPGVMKKLGLGYEELKQRNPRLIYAASSGFGQTGPYSSLPAYDLIIQGLGGVMSITGPDAATPTKVGTSIADILSGIFTCVGVLAALQNRERTGQGQMVDVGMLDCMVAILENAIARYATLGQVPQPLGNRHPSIAPFCTLPTRDGAINVACGNDELWRRYCELAGLGALLRDPRFATNPLRVQHWSELEQLLHETMRARTSAEWTALLRPAGVPVGPIQTIDQLMQDPHVLARDMLVELTHPVAGTVKVPGTPLKFSETAAQVSEPAPLLGQHNEAVLSGLLGRSLQEIARLKAEQVI